MITGFDRVNADDIIQIKPEIFTCQSADLGGSTIIVLKFSGLYHDGSLGSPDASFMMAFLKAIVHRYLPASIILDFSELHGFVA